MPLTRLTPDSRPSPATDWFVVLRDWKHGEQAVDSVTRVLQTASNPIPAVFVVMESPEDCSDRTRSLLNQLVEAGATLLVPHDEAESVRAQKNPAQFVEAQIQQATMATQTSPPPAAEAGIAEAAHSSGYRAFATAVTRLPEPDLKDLIEGQPPSRDWKYEI